MLSERSRCGALEKGTGVLMEDRSGFRHLPWRSLDSTSSFPNPIWPFPFPSRSLLQLWRGEAGGGGTPRVKKTPHLPALGY